MANTADALGLVNTEREVTGELDRTYTEDITGLEALDVEQAVTTWIGRSENRDAASRALSASNAAKTLQ